MLIQWILCDVTTGYCIYIVTRINLYVNTIYLLLSLKHMFLCVASLVVCIQSYLGHLLTSQQPVQLTAGRYRGFVNLVTLVNLVKTRGWAASESKNAPFLFERCLSCDILLFQNEIIALALLVYSYIVCTFNS